MLKVRRTVKENRKLSSIFFGLLACILAPFLFTTLIGHAAPYDLEATYGQLGLEKISQISEFKFDSFRRTDEQSILVIGKSSRQYLLVLDGRVSSTVTQISFPSGSRNIKSGYTRVTLVDRSGEDRRKIVLIYSAADRVEANSVVARLRNGIK